MNAPRQPSDGFALAVVVESGLAVFAAALAWMFSVHLRSQFPQTGAQAFQSLLRGVLATLPLLALLGVVASSKWAPLVHLRSQVEWLVAEMFPSAGPAEFALIGALAGVGEEILFRGVLQTKLVEWTTPAAGVLLASLLFGIAHSLSVTYFLFAVVVGVFLGWLALAYDDLLAPILAHGLYDFFALTYIARTNRLRALESAKHVDVSDDPPTT